jgi:hypothetical protein
MFKRTTASDPESLNSELVEARAQYNATVQSVIERVEVRREQIGQVITDLKAEDEALATISRNV